MHIKTKYSQDKKTKITLKLSEDGYYAIQKRIKLKQWKTTKYYKLKSRRMAENLYDRL